MFGGILTSRPRCDVCGLDFRLCRRRRRAGGVRNLAGRLHRCGAALVTEVEYHPPHWLHAVLWLPVILIVTLGPLRPAKGLMIALQYFHKAAEGRLAGRAGHEHE